MAVALKPSAHFFPFTCDSSFRVDEKRRTLCPVISKRLQHHSSKCSKMQLIQFSFKLSLQLKNNTYWCFDNEAVVKVKQRVKEKILWFALFSVLSREYQRITPWEAIKYSTLVNCQSKRTIHTLLTPKHQSAMHIYKTMTHSNAHCSQHHQGQSLFLSSFLKSFDLIHVNMKAQTVYRSS